MIIKNASIYTEDHTFVNGNAVVENGRFVSFSDFSEQDAQIVDAQGLYMIPGLVDIHFHGCMGADMCDGTKEALDIITRYEASIGVTSVCPATMTIAKDELLNVMKNAGDYAYNGGAHLVGINMEGPFISASKKGAQAEENILHCDYEYFCRLQKAARGLIKLVDLAPEEPGAMEFIEKAIGKGIVGLDVVGAGIYAFLNRLLIPTGLHHALNNVFWFDTIGLGDLQHFWAGETSADVSWSLGMYMSGFFPCMMFGIPGAALAMVKCAKPAKKKVAIGLVASAAICAFICGVTEPFEFGFMFLHRYFM